MNILGALHWLLGPGLPSALGAALGIAIIGWSEHVARLRRKNARLAEDIGVQRAVADRLRRYGDKDAVTIHNLRRALADTKPAHGKDGRFVARNHKGKQ